jgi:hypothetical protein
MPVLDGNFFTLAEVALAMRVDEARVREWIEMLAIPWTYIPEAGGPAVRRDDLEVLAAPILGARFPGRRPRRVRGRVIGRNRSGGGLLGSVSLPPVR